MQGFIRDTQHSIRCRLTGFKDPDGIMMAREPSLSARQRLAPSLHIPHVDYGLTSSNCTKRDSGNMEIRV